MTIDISLPPRPLEAHKGDFGRVLVVGGSVGMAGAIGLTALAALRSGSGLVIVATPEDIQPTVAAFSPCFMTLGCDCSDGRFSKDAVKPLIKRAQWADVVALGPGLGRHKSLQKLTAKLYSELEQPVVVDADALNNLADSQADLAAHAGMRILTPHPGEFCRIAGRQITDRQELEDQAVALAERHEVVLVLKGHRTLVTDGSQSSQNQTGNPGMATGGTGDVLTGVIASLIGQSLDPLDAARWGVHLHGLAGDLAAKEKGQVSLIATDIIEYLPQAFVA